MLTNAIQRFRYSIVLLAGILFILSFWSVRNLWRNPSSGTLPLDPPTPYTFYPGVDDGPRPAVLVVHGLDASRRFMQIISLAIADQGFPVYAIDLPGHGDSGANFNALLAKDVVNQALDWLEARYSEVIPLGHSMGSGLLLDLANEREFDRIILFSPPPVPIARAQIREALVVTGEWDVPHINAFVPEIQSEAGAGVVWLKLDWAAHSSAVVNPAHLKRMVDWLIGNDANVAASWKRWFWLILQFASAGALAVALFHGSPVRRRPQPWAPILLHYVVACSVAVIVLRFTAVLSWIHLFATDYIVGFLFVSGLVLLASKEARHLQMDMRAIVKALVAATFVIVVMGVLSASHLIDFLPSGGRWWRFGIITLAGLPLFISDEAVLRPSTRGWRGAALGILTRVLVGTSIATGVLILNRENSFLVLIIYLVVLFWITLWLLSHLVHRYVQNPLAAALFAALVQGWCFASWFVTV